MKCDRVAQGHVSHLCVTRRRTMFCCWPGDTPLISALILSESCAQGVKKQATAHYKYQSQGQRTFALLCVHVDWSCCLCVRTTIKRGDNAR